MVGNGEVVNRVVCGCGRGGWCCGLVRKGMREAESGNCVVELPCVAMCVVLLRVMMEYDGVVCVRP